LAAGESPKAPAYNPRVKRGRPSVLLAAVGIALKTLLALLVYAMPFLGFWIASSLAARAAR
jgi:hypothetical protein